MRKLRILSILVYVGISLLYTVLFLPCFIFTLLLYTIYCHVKFYLKISFVSIQKHRWNPWYFFMLHFFHERIVTDRNTVSSDDDPKMSKEKMGTEFEFTNLLILVGCGVLGG